MPQGQTNLKLALVQCTLNPMEYCNNVNAKGMPNLCVYMSFFTAALGLLDILCPACFLLFSRKSLCLDRQPFAFGLSENFLKKR